MNRRPLAAWADDLPADADALAADARTVDAEEARVADLEAAFTRKFGAVPASWPAEARRLFLRIAGDVHRYYSRPGVA